MHIPHAIYVVTGASWCGSVHLEEPAETCVNVVPQKCVEVLVHVDVMVRVLLRITALHLFQCGLADLSQLLRSEDLRRFILILQHHASLLHIQSAFVEMDALLLHKTWQSRLGLCAHKRFIVELYLVLIKPLRRAKLLLSNFLCSVYLLMHVLALLLFLNIAEIVLRHLIWADLFSYFQFLLLLW